MPARKSLRLQVFLVVALVASCLVCDTCLTVSQVAQVSKGSKFLKILLSPTRFQRVMKSRSNDIVLPAKASWYPGFSGALKVVSLSGEADELLGTIGKLCEGTRDRPRILTAFPFLLPRSALGALLGPDGLAIEELRQELQSLLSSNAEVKFDSDFEGRAFVTGSAAEVILNVFRPNYRAVQAVAKWIMDKQDVQDELARNMRCGYSADSDTLDSEIRVKLSPECIRALLRNRGKDVQRLRDEYFVDFAIDKDYSDATISGLLGDVSACHRHITVMEARFEREQRKRGPSSGSSDPTEENGVGMHQVLPDSSADRVPVPVG